MLLLLLYYYYYYSYYFSSYLLLLLLHSNSNSYSYCYCYCYCCYYSSFSSKPSATPPPPLVLVLLPPQALELLASPLFLLVPLLYRTSLALHFARLCQEQPTTRYSVCMYMLGMSQLAPCSTQPQRFSGLCPYTYIYTHVRYKELKQLRQRKAQAQLGHGHVRFNLPLPKRGFLRQLEKLLELILCECSLCTRRSGMISCVCWHPWSAEYL